MDKVPPIGSAISCSWFEMFSTFLQWAFTQNSGHKLVLHYLDDLFFVGHAGDGRMPARYAVFSDVEQ